jgi:N utilization substance protein B
VVLRVLYQADVMGEPIENALADVLDDPAPRHPDAHTALLQELPAGEDPEPERLHPALARYVSDLARSVADHLDAIDAALARAAENWTLERMSTVDRNVLRIGAAELLFHADVPVKVAINEAILLARAYGGPESGAFVNGILDRVARDHGAERAASG